MTKSNKILLKALLNFEFELGKSQQILNKNSIFFNIQFNFNKIYDLFELIISAFNIPEYNYDSLYNLLNNLYLNQISVENTLISIENLIK